MSTEPPGQTPPAPAGFEPQPSPGAGGGEPGGRGPGWGPTRVLSGLAALLLLLVLEAGIVFALDPGEAGVESVGGRLVLQGLLALTMLGVAFAVAGWPSGLARPRELGLRAAGGSPIRSAAIAYGLYILSALVIAVLLQPDQQDVTRELGADEGGGAAVAAGFLIVLAAPPAEELFFRGFMFAGLRRRLPLWPAALIAAAVWGVFHYTGEGSEGVVVQLTVFGLILAWLYERTGSLWPPIALHVLNNALAFALLTSSA